MLVLKSRNQKIAVSSMFAAICCVATMVVRIPTIGTNGYVNIGDTVVFLCACLIGGVYGVAAAGVGSALADLLADYPQYVPGTFVIKAAMALTIILIIKLVQKYNINKTLGYIVAGAVAEIVMVAGYFLYEATILGYGVAAAASIPSNIAQGGTCLVISVILIKALEANRAFKRLNVM